MPTLSFSCQSCGSCIDRFFVSQSSILETFDCDSCKAKDSMKQYIGSAPDVLFGKDWVRGKADFKRYMDSGPFAKYTTGNKDGS